MLKKRISNAFIPSVVAAALLLIQIYTADCYAGDSVNDEPAPENKETVIKIDKGSIEYIGNEGDLLNIIEFPNRPEGHRRP